MLRVLALLAILASCLAMPQRDTEPLSGVKGRLHQVYNSSNSFLDTVKGLRNLTGEAHTAQRNNGSAPRPDFERGVCYEEVPTATIAKDPHNVPAGNGSNPSLSKVRKCCPGYERNAHNFRLCEPVCEHECVNARCIAPNVCACHADHVLDRAGYCVTTCPIGCLNGQCGPDNECVCNRGYEEDFNMKYCVPKCSKGCGHGNCTAPETCLCESGYELNPEGLCTPKCSHGCSNGLCVSPEECRCNAGYEKSPTDPGVCKPVCSLGCPNGECVSPDVCSCAPGFSRAGPGAPCTASCSHPCLNGDCTGPDQCTCRKGYIKDENDPAGHKCIGHCPNGCPNGTCSGPNLCLCLPGYVKERGVKGAQRCVRRERRSIPHKLMMMLP